MRAHLFCHLLHLATSGFLHLKKKRKTVTHTNMHTLQLFRFGVSGIQGCSKLFPVGTLLLFSEPWMFPSGMGNQY
jgi:hypothetical protein